MNRIEFLEKLKVALENDLSGQVVQDNIKYYDQYITDEMRSGKTEQEVLELLGDPWMLARTIIDSPANSGDAYTYDSKEQVYSSEERPKNDNSLHIMRLDTWWKKFLIILCVLGVFGVIISLVTGIISLLAPIALPVIMILILMRIVRGNKR